jgi:hypothetical protein
MQVIFAVDDLGRSLEFYERALAAVSAKPPRPLMLGAAESAPWAGPKTIASTFASMTFERQPRLSRRPALGR